MLTTERPWTATTAEAISPADFGLRLHGGTDDERLISVPPGKHSIGSGPRCSLRLQYEGVQPLECLIVRDESGLRVRRWSDDSRLNGVPFDEASLTSGDVLSVGPVDLEVVLPQTGDSYVEPEEPLAEIVEPAIESVDAALASVYEMEADLPCAAEDAPQVLQPTITHSEWDTPEETERPAATEVAAAFDEVKAERRIATSIARRRSRRVLAALRRQRNDFNELVARVNDLTRLVEHVLTEPKHEALDKTEIADELAQPVEALIEPNPQFKVLETELVDVRQQLTAREAEMAQARYSIDVLERQLIDSQHTMHAFADERVIWEEQCTELESRLADYVERIQILEQQLNLVRAAKAEEAAASPLVNTEWAAESDSNEPVAGEVVDTEFVSTVDEHPWNAPTDEDATCERVVDESVPAEAEQVSVETVVEPENTTTAEPVAEADAAPEHLQGLSIWRQEPEEATQQEEGGSSPTTVEEASVKSPPEQASFIERYAHLLPADDAAVEPPVAPSRAPAVVDATHATSDDEESVEQYMAKLMERMRGTAGGESEANETIADTVKIPAPDEAAADAGAAAEVAPPNHEPITDIEELRSKVGVPELAIDRMAMRALANQSARQAIGVHAARSLRRSAQSRLIVALLGASAGLYLLLDAPGWKSLQFAAGCAAVFIAVYWGKLTLETLVKAIRVGAFEDEVEEVAPEESLHPPLPIDVERPKD